MDARVAESVEQPTASTGTKRRGRVENLKPFKKGQSGNPSGRPKKVLDAKAQAAELALKHAQKAIQTLVEVMEDPATPPSSRIQAAGEVLDRALGKPQANVKADVKVDFVQRFEAYIRELNGLEPDRRIEADDAEVVPLLPGE